MQKVIALRFHSSWCKNVMLHEVSRPQGRGDFIAARQALLPFIPTPCGSESKGPFSFAKENGPFGTPRERLRLAVQSLNDLCASGMRLPARGVAALGVARRFASAPIIRCRSAHLVEVRSNSRLPPVSTMRRAQQAAFGKQSAAEQTSLAPHDSKARLRVVTTCRRFMAKPCTPHPTTRKGCAASVRRQSRQRLRNSG